MASVTLPTITFTRYNPNGTLKWEFTACGGDTYSSPAIGADGTIYVGSLDGNLYAITPGGTRSGRT